MLKPLMIIGLLGTFGAAGLGYMNRSKFLELRKEKDEAARSAEGVLKGLETTELPKITEIKTAWTDSLRKRAADDSARNSTNKETNRLKEDTTATMAKRDATQKEIDTMVANFNTALKDLGITEPDQLGVKRDAMKAEVLALTEEVSKLDKEIEILNGILKENERQLSKQNDVQSQRAKSIALGTREGLVTAVNPDYGFLIINLGQNDGVSAESKLLVKRGMQLIGKVKIKEITNNLTVADYAADKLAVLPGDEVIFDSAN